MSPLSVLFLLAMGGTGTVQAADSAPLLLESKIDLGDVSGRIDHLAIDLVRRRLYVAELGNDSMAVVDLTTGKLMRTVGGFSEPQGIAYEPLTDTIYVANGGDGSVRLLGGADFQPVGRVDLGDDADNVRVDAAHRTVIVGYGTGALALINPQTHMLVANIPLKAHPESFRLTIDGQRTYINVPDAHEIAVVDLTKQKQIAAWPMHELNANFPLILNEPEHELWTVFRHPAKVVAIDTATGALSAIFDSCGDADDLFFDAKRHRLYVSCGDGNVDVWEKRGTEYSRIARLTTPAGARTALFVPELDRLYLAVRATSGKPAAIWVFRVPT
jgi:DNA-binding beta-propeller fold protein YncE